METLKKISDLLKQYKNKMISSTDLTSELNMLSQKDTYAEGKEYYDLIQAIILNLEEVVLHPAGSDLEYFINSLNGIPGFPLSYRSLQRLSIDDLTDVELKIIKIADDYCLKKEISSEDRDYIRNSSTNNTNLSFGIQEICNLFCDLFLYQKRNSFLARSIEEKIERIVFLIKNDGYFYRVVTFESGSLIKKYIY